MEDVDEGDDAPEASLHGGVRRGAGTEASATSASVLASVLESPDRIVIFSLDREYRYTAFNTNHRATMKRIWDVDIALGTSMLELIADPTDRARAKVNFDRALKGERFTRVEEYGEPPNRYVYENIYNPILDEAGAVIGLTVFLTDITDRRRAQDELARYHDQLEELVAERTAELRDAYERLARETRERQRTQEMLERAQRLEALGTLAGGVAHDFNNLLTVFVGYTDVLARRLPEDAVEQTYLEKLRAACRHGAELTSRLLAFGRRQVLQPTHLDLDTIVRETVGFLEHVLPESVTVVVDDTPALPTVRADRAQLEQVVVNLALNARDAMPEGGHLRIATRHHKDVHVPDGVRAECPHGAVCLTVQDDGCGMAPDLVERIFDPFFTTKESGKGTGLGLSMVYGIVEQHGGWIRVRSQRGVGSSFEVFLPATDRAPDRPTLPPDAALSALGRGRRVLVVDDEPEIREMVRELLSNWGFEVVLAEDASTAIAAFEAAASGIDVLFSDVVLPDLDGVQLAQRLVARQPGLPVLLASGYSETVVDPDQLVSLPSYRYLPKPYEPHAVITALAELLA